MDNNRIQLSKIEYENLYTVTRINPVTISGADVKVNKEFNDAMKKAKKSAKKNKDLEQSDSNEDIVVDNSLEKLITEDNEVSKRVEERIARSKIIKELLSKKNENKITPSENEAIKK